MVAWKWCQRLTGGHCQHWNLTEEEHALLHAYARRVTDVADADAKAGVYEELGGGLIKSSGSTSGIADDGPAIAKLLHDEGYEVVKMKAGPGESLRDVAERVTPGVMRALEPDGGATKAGPDAVYDGKRGQPSEGDGSY